ncbi:MAG: DUF3253 domain-containing protein [Pseudomonadota bacterium]
MSDAARAAILTLLEARREGATICPSEAARKLDPKDWRGRMGEVRGAAASLAAEGRVVVTQKGVAVDVALARGPVRIGRATEGTE